MTLDFDTCYRAVLARDPRFDGRFFTAVTSTGVYCRPVCPARTPARRNMRFYPHAGAADADPAARHAVRAAAAARLAASDSRRGLCPGRVTVYGRRRAIGFTGMTYPFLVIAGARPGGRSARHDPSLDLLRPAPLWFTKARDKSG